MKPLTLLRLSMITDTELPEVKAATWDEFVQADASWERVAAQFADTELLSDLTPL